MAGSTVQGSPGAAYNGATVLAIRLLNNVAAGVQTSDVVVAGAFSLSGLPGPASYQIKIVLNNNQNADRAGSDVTNALVLNTISVDGVSSYKI